MGILSCQYFLVYGGIQIARTWTQFTSIAANFTSKAENALMTATASMNFAPMLAVLFIGARMRALNMDRLQWCTLLSPSSHHQALGQLARSSLSPLRCSARSFSHANTSLSMVASKWHAPGLS